MPNERKFLLQNKEAEFGFVYYNEETGKFRIVFNKDIKASHIPAMVYIPISCNKYVLEGNTALTWIQERLTPSNRQNITDFLIKANLTEYTEIGMLSAYKGRCCQDNMWIEEIK